MDSNDRKLLRLVLPPLLGLGLAAALTHPLDQAVGGGPQPTGTASPSRTVTPQLTDGNTP